MHYDFLDERSAAEFRGIKTLLAAEWQPNSAAVKSRQWAAVLAREDQQSLAALVISSKPAMMQASSRSPP
jgi:hypothetical protein